jgi:hypothetical protein
VSETYSLKKIIGKSLTALLFLVSLTSFAPPYDPHRCGLYVRKHARQAMFRSRVTELANEEVAETFAYMLLAFSQFMRSFAEREVLANLWQIWERDLHIATGERGEDVSRATPEEKTAAWPRSKAFRLLTERIKAAANRSTPRKYSALREHFPFDEITWEALERTAGLVILMSEIDAYRALYYRAFNHMQMHPADYPTDRLARARIAGSWAAANAHRCTMENSPWIELQGYVNLPRIVTDLRSMERIDLNENFEHFSAKHLAPSQTDQFLNLADRVAADPRVPLHQSNWMKTYTGFCREEHLPPLGEFSSEIEELAQVLELVP